MKKTKHLKRILSLILSVTVFASTFNVNAFASESGVDVGTYGKTDGVNSCYSSIRGDNGSCN